MSLKVLLADDSVPAQNMGKKILVDAGYDVVTASNGLEAWRKISDVIPDIAILDIFMPGYSGLELCARLRAGAQTASLPVILTVGKLEPYRPEDGEQVHSSAVIVKPFSADELIGAVRSLVGTSPAAEVLPEPEAEVPPGEVLSMDAEADPLQQSHAGSEHSGLGHAALEDPLAGEPSGAAAHEPLPLIESAAAGMPLDADEPISYGGGEPLLTAVDSGGPESLVFNPDAARTPFSASAADEVLSPEAPAAEQTPAAEIEPEITEFDMDAAPSGYSAESSPELLDGSEPIETEASIAAQEIAPEAQVAPEPELAPLEIPVADPLLDAQADVSEEAAAEAGGDEVLADAEEEHLTPEEEARRDAFEELYSLSDVFPLDEPAPAESAPAEAGYTGVHRLPSLASLTDDLPLDAAPDSELEAAATGSQEEPVESEPDPYLLEELEPINAVGDIPGRDVLLGEDAEAEWIPPENVQPSSESFTSALYSSQPDVLGEELPPMLGDAAQAEEQQGTAVAPLEEPEPLGTAPGDELAQTAEVLPEPTQSVEAISAGTATQHLTPPVAQPAAETSARPIAADTAEAAQVAPEATPELVGAIPEAEIMAAEVAAEPLGAAPEAAAIESVQHPATVAAEAANVEAAAEPIEPAAEAAPKLVEAIPEAAIAALVPMAAVAAAVYVEAAAEPNEVAAEPATQPAAQPVAAEAEVAGVEVEAAPVPHVVPHVVPEVEALPTAAAHVAQVAEYQAAVTEPAVKAQAEVLSSAPEAIPEFEDSERIRRAVDRAFDRFKSLLVKAIVRELNRKD